MYAYPTLLRPFSNREDFLTTVSIFDDDTGDPIKLDGCVTQYGQPFTGSTWSVISGTLDAFSTTTLTIPVFPIASVAQTALFLQLPVNLAINPGDPVKIVDPTGQNYMTGLVTSYDPQKGAMVVQIGLTFAFELRRGLPRDDFDYVPYFYGPGTVQDSGPLLRATLGQGIAITDIGWLQVLFPAPMVQKLYGGTYIISLVMSDGASTRQVFLGTVAVFNGSLSPSPLQPSVGPLWN
jgi:hypothetical protein